jgi:transposase
MKTLEDAPLNTSKSEVEILQEKLLAAEKEIARINTAFSQSKEQLAWLLRQLFGKKSEKVVSDVSDEQLTFEGFFTELPASPVKPEPEPKPRRKPVRNGNDAIKLPSDLPVKTTIIDIPEKDKFCKETGLPLNRIGEEITLKLAHTPGSYYILEIIRPKYATPHKEEEGILCADLPSTIFPKCRADDSLLADILVKKYADHLPLYRISEILSRENIGISRKLLSQWVMHCGFALTPLYNEMVKKVLSSGNIFVDESPINVQVPGGVKKGYMWVIVGGNEANPPYRIYDFAEDRCHAHIFNILDGYAGVLHSDKYGAYETLSKKKQIIWNPCWTHIRRYFFEVESGDLDFCKWAIRKIRYLYMLERVAWNRSPEERLKIRQEKEVPIIEELIKEIKERVAKADYLPKSKFSKALNYFMGLLPYLKNYTKHPNSRIDNNVAERAVRPLAIGRKNWLFFGSLNAGQHSAIIFSLIQTCRGLGINPREYLEDIFRRLMDHNSQKLDELLPDQWLLSKQRSQPT